MSVRSQFSLARLCSGAPLKAHGRQSNQLENQQEQCALVVYHRPHVVSTADIYSKVRDYERKYHHTKQGTSLLQNVQYIQHIRSTVTFKLRVQIQIQQAEMKSKSQRRSSLTGCRFGVELSKWSPLPRASAPPILVNIRWHQ